MDEATEPLGDVANPAGFAVFAVADYVNADVCLLANNTGNFSRRVFSYAASSYDCP